MSGGTVSGGGAVGRDVSGGGVRGGDAGRSGRSADRVGGGDAAGGGVRGGAVNVGGQSRGAVSGGGVGGGVTAGSRELGDDGGGVCAGAVNVSGGSRGLVSRGGEAGGGADSGAVRGSVSLSAAGGGALAPGGPGGGGSGQASAAQVGGGASPADLRAPRDPGGAGGRLPPAAFDPQAWVRAFHKRHGVPVPGAPGLPAAATAAMRLRLIREETRELEDALAAGDLVEVADAIADLLYVALGTAVACGIDMAPIFAEVHRSNMTKDARAGAGPDGKVVKGAGFEPPVLAPLLRAQGWRPGEGAARLTE